MASTASRVISPQFHWLIASIKFCGRGMLPMGSVGMVISGIIPIYHCDGFFASNSRWIDKRARFRYTRCVSYEFHSCHTEFGLTSRCTPCLENADWEDGRLARGSVLADAWGLL